MPNTTMSTIFCFIGRVVLIRSGSEMASMKASEEILKHACVIA